MDRKTRGKNRVTLSLYRRCERYNCRKFMILTKNIAIHYTASKNYSAVTCKLNIYETKEIKSLFLKQVVNFIYTLVDIRRL